MKKNIIFVGLSFLFITFANANYVPTFLELESNQATYEIGDQALLMAHVRIQPVHSDYELYLKSKFSTTNLAIDQVAGNEYVAFPPVLQESGTFAWIVNVYIQDRHLTMALNHSKIQLEKENLKIDQDLVNETDPAEREFLLRMKSRNNTIISKINSELEEGRRHLQTIKLNVVVNPIQTKNLDQPPVALLNVELDREDSTYRVGEQINFVVTRVADLTGNEILEHILRAKLKSWPVALFDTDDENVKNGQSFVLANNHVGEQSLNVYLFLRPKEKAQHLRDGIDSAQKKRIEYIELKNNYPNDPVRQSYFEFKITRLGIVISNYYNVLESMLDLVTTNESVVFINR